LSNQASSNNKTQHKFVNKTRHQNTQAKRPETVQKLVALSEKQLNAIHIKKRASKQTKMFTKPAIKFLSRSHAKTPTKTIGKLHISRAKKHETKHRKPQYQ